MLQYIRGSQTGGRGALSGRGTAGQMNGTSVPLGTYVTTAHHSLLIAIILVIM